MNQAEVTPVRRTAQGPPRLYAWDISRDGHRDGEAGVTDNRGAAIGHVCDALTDAEPGASGLVRLVTLNPSGRTAYVDLRTVAEAHIDESTGIVVWTAA